ncbi:Protein terminal ear1 [Linum perenne]
MGDAGGGFFRFPASLDPQAQEFRPRDHQRHVIAVLPPPQPFYYHHPPPQLQTPPPLPFGYQHQFQNHVVTVNNYDRVGSFNHGGGKANPPPPAVAPTRAILVSSLPVDGRVSETLVRRELEVFGAVRGVQMERIRDGIVTVHFYDIRHAEAALDAIRDHQYHMHRRRRRPFEGWPTVWAQFTIPSIHAMPEGQNQGTIVVFNLDPNASAYHLRQIFQPYGAVKEIRETPMKKQQRFIEFYDIRDASKALNNMNGKEILGKPVVIEFSRPGGFNRKFFNPPHKNIHPFSPPPPPPASRLSNSPPPPLLAPRQILKRNPSYEAKKVISLGGKKLSNSKPWKWGKISGKLDSRFLINDELIDESSSSSKNWSNTDSRTTVMIKNIPNKYSQKLLLNMLDNHCINCNEQINNHDDEQPFSSYDFVYLPIDFNQLNSNKCNVGYGFVNMTSPQAARRLYKAFHGQHWEVFNSKKICEVTYARVQGLEALKEHFKNSKFPSETEHYLPVVFSPPRDGRELTEPVAIVCLKQSQSQEGEGMIDGVEDGLKKCGLCDEGNGGGGGGGGGDSDGNSDSSGGGRSEI